MPPERGLNSTLCNGTRWRECYQVNIAEDRYHALFDANPDALLVLDGAARILLANPAARALLELGDECPAVLQPESLGLANEPWEAVISRADRGAVVMWEANSFGAPPAGAADRTSATSRVMEIQLSRLPASSDAGAPAEYLWVAHNVTDRVRLERARQDPVNMVVHDLRVPLGNILNSLDLVLSAWREQDLTIPVLQILEIGLRSARRMEQLVSDILDSARLQVRQHPLAVSDIDVPQMVNEVVEAIASSAARRGQVVLTSLQPDLPPLQGDRDMLSRVLSNLVANAVKFVQEGGEIRLDVVADAEAYRFTVSDNGPGIPAEEHSAVFDLYVRGDGQRAKGAGIGLAFCKLAVNAHGGRIWIDSAPGKGSSFSFTIPRVLPRSAIYHQETRP